MLKFSLKCMQMYVQYVWLAETGCDVRCRGALSHTAKVKWAFNLLLYLYRDIQYYLQRWSVWFAHHSFVVWIQLSGMQAAAATSHTSVEAMTHYSKFRHCTFVQVHVWCFVLSGEHFTIKLFLAMYHHSMATMMMNFKKMWKENQMERLDVL